MLPRRAIFVCLVVVASILCHALPVTPAEAIQWREDLHYFTEQAPQVHKNLFHSMTREQFDTAVKSLDERIPTLSRNQIIVEIVRIVAAMETVTLTPRFRVLPRISGIIRSSSTGSQTEFTF